MVKKTAIAIIPARGGSKRIKHKNIVDFCGVPMIARTIQAAQAAHHFDRILVSTDSEEIARVAREYGAEVPFLREEKKDDFTPVSEATIYALRQAEAYFGESYAYVVQLMANCPLRSAADIEDAWQAFMEKGRMFQISCFAYGWMNPWWAVKLDADETPTRLFPEAAMQRSQDLGALYCPTGAIWMARADVLKEAGTFYGPGYRMHPMPWQSAFDIDNYEDLEMAKMMMRSCVKR